jgi:hypothetical protein
MRKKLAVLLAIIMVIEFSPEVVLGATLATWNVVQAPESVLSEIYQFDGECYIGKRGDSWILADSDMNLLFRDAPNKIKKMGDGFYQVNNSEGEWGVINSKGDTIVPMTKKSGDSPLKFGVNSEGKLCFSSYIGLYNEEGKRITSYGDCAGAEEIEVYYYNEESSDVGESFGYYNLGIGYTTSALNPASYICVCYKGYKDDSWETLSEEYYNFDGEKISEDDYSKYGIGDVKEEEKTSRELKMESYLEQCAKELQDEYESYSSWKRIDTAYNSNLIYSIEIDKNDGAEVKFYYYFDNDGTCIREKQEECVDYFLTDDALYYYGDNMVFRLNKDIDPEYHSLSDSR